MEQNNNFSPQRVLEREWRSVPDAYKQYIPLGALAGAAGLGLAVARLLEERRRRQRSLRHRSEKLMSQALEKSGEYGELLREKGGEYGEYLLEHSSDMARDLEKRTRKMRKQLRRQAQSANKLVQQRAGGALERLRDQDYDRLRLRTADQLERLSGLLASYGGVLAAHSQQTARSVAGRAQDIAHETPEFIQQVSELAQELTAALKNTVQSTASTVGEHAQQLASSAPETLRHAGERTSGHAQQMAEALQERVSGTALEARRKSKRGRTGLKALLLGLAAGILIAPRAGEEQRARLRQRFEHGLSSLLRTAGSSERVASRQKYDAGI